MMIVVVCKGRQYREKDRIEAIKFWGRCMRETRGEERAMYAKVVCGLLDGKRKIVVA